MWTLWVASDPANSDLHRVEAAARNLGVEGPPMMGPGFTMMNTLQIWAIENVTSECECDGWTVASRMV